MKINQSWSKIKMKRKDSHHRTTIDYSSKDSSKNGKPKLNGSKLLN